jgi:hypothetical protein
MIIKLKADKENRCWVTERIYKSDPKYDQEEKQKDEE